MVDIAEGKLVASEKAKLRKVLSRFDLVLFTACAIVSLDSVAFAAEAGAQAITWLLISLVLFLIPYGMLVAELGAAFPVEGGPYEWVKMSSGRLTGSITAVLYWLANPIWVGGTLAAVAIATLNDFVLGKPLGTTGEIVVGLIFTWVTVGAAIIAFRYGKWAPNIGTIVKIAVVAIFTILLIVYLARHGPAGRDVHRRRPEAVAQRVPHGDRGPGLPVGRLRAVQRRLGGDAQPAAGRAQDDRPVGGDRRRAVRPGDRRHHPGDLPGQPVERVGLHRRLQGRRRRSALPRAERRVRDPDHPHPHRQRLGLAGGRRPDPGHRRAGRRRPRLDGPVDQLRTPIAVNLASGVVARRSSSLFS
jgi:Amino acid transporters